VDAMDFLRECGGAIDARSDRGDCALHMACQSKSLEALEYLLLHIPTLINSRNYEGMTPCDVCVTGGGRLPLLLALQAKGGVPGRDLPKESAEKRAAREAEEKRCEEDRRRVEAEQDSRRIGGAVAVDIPTE
jgi:ankyrin repeat protein